MSGKIFVSYRRSDTKGYTHVVAQPLMDYFGEDQVFLDVYDIELGRDYVDVLEQAVSSCDVLLAMIGPGWLNASLPDHTERRLDDPQDFVRIEVATALKRNIRVIPVLVQNATMPGEKDLPDVLKPLARRQAFVIGERPAQDIEYQLIPALQRALNEAASERQARETGQGSALDESSRYRSSDGYVYVLSPKGRQEDKDGNWIDFDQVYQQVIKPAIQKTGFTPVRADEEALYYDITPADQIQYLLLSEIVIADISIHDADTFYQLGLRHALRKRGVIHINSSKKNTPIQTMDISAVTYFVAGSGLPDPAEKDADIEKIYRAIMRSFLAGKDAVQSPVFDLLETLEEADVRRLRTPYAVGYWREYNEWKDRFTEAQRQKRIGDILILTEEIINPTIRGEALLETVNALRNMGKYSLALDLCRQGLYFQPKEITLRRQEAFCLNRLGRVDEAILKLESLLQEFPQDTESLTYLARVYKDLWTKSWNQIENKKKRISEAYRSAHWLVRAINIYLNAYRKDFNGYYTGFNAVTLGSLLDHLARRFDEAGNPQIDEVRAVLPELKGSLQLTLESIAEDDDVDYWGLTSLAELYVASAEDVEQVTQAYQKAITKARKNSFYLTASLNQLDMLQALDFRPEFVAAGKRAIQEELATMEMDAPLAKSAAATSAGRKVLFLAGQPMDKPDQPIPVFPAAMEAEAKKSIEAVLGKYDAGKKRDDLVCICTGVSAGAELLFCETALSLGFPIRIYLPSEEERYIKDQAAFAGEAWVQRYDRVSRHPLTHIFIQDQCLGPTRPGMDPIRRNARWGLYSALARTVYEGDFNGVFLWDGRAVDGTYGAVIRELIEFFKQKGGYVEQINLANFDYFKKPRRPAKAAPKKKPVQKKKPAQK